MLCGLVVQDDFSTTGVNELLARSSAVGGLAGGFAFLRILWRGFPSGTLEQTQAETNGHGEIRRLVFSEDCEVHSDHAPRRTEQRRTRSTFGSSGVVHDSSHVEIRDAALSGEWLNAFRLRELSELGHRRVVALLNSSRLRLIEECQQTIRSGRITHHDD